MSTKKPAETLPEAPAETPHTAPVASVIILHNRTKQITALRGFFCENGKPIVLGIEADRGLVNQAQPEVRVKRSEYDKMKRNPAIYAMMNEHPVQLEAKTPFAL